MADPREDSVVIKRWISVQRFGNTLGRDLKKQNRVALRELRRIINSKSSQLIKRRKIKQVIKKLRDDSKAFVYSEMRELADQTYNLGLNDAENLGLDKQIKKRKITDRELNSVIRSHSLDAQNGTLGDQFNRAYSRMQKKAFATMTALQSQDLTTEEIEFEFNSAISQADNSVSAVATTITNSVYNSVQEIVFDQVADVEYMWVSALDHRTTPFCQAADGKRFKKGKGPRPPAHINCRSIIIIVLASESDEEIHNKLRPRAAVTIKSVEALKAKGLRTSGGKVRKPRRNDSSPLKGTTTNKPTYEEYLRAQPVAYIDAILGKRDSKSFRAGNSLLSVLKKSKTKVDFSSLMQATN